MVTTLRRVQMAGDQPIPEVETILASLAGTLSGEEKARFDHDTAVIMALVAPGVAFSVEEYVTNEVKRALHH